MTEHLQLNEVDLNQTALTLGTLLNMDPAIGLFIKNPKQIYSLGRSAVRRLWCQPSLLSRMPYGRLYFSAKASRRAWSVQLRIVVARSLEHSEPRFGASLGGYPQVG